MNPRRWTWWAPELVSLVLALVLLALLVADISLRPAPAKPPITPCYVGSLREVPTGWMVVLRPVECP